MKRSLAAFLLLASGLVLSAVAQSPAAPSSTPSTGQSGRIHGHVDGPAGATGTVFLSGPEEHSFPISASGDYSGEAAPGSYSLVVQELDRSAGYPQLTKFNTSVDILPGKDLQLDFDRSGNPHAQMEEITTQDSGGATSPTSASTRVQGSAPARSETVPAISFQQAVFQTDEGKRLFSDLQKKYEPKRAQLKALNDEVQAMTKQLQADSAKLSDAPPVPGRSTRKRRHWTGNARKPRTNSKRRCRPSTSPWPPGSTNSWFPMRSSKECRLSSMPSRTIWL